MKKFTDFLDNYILALGVHNQAHSLHQSDPLRFTNEFHEAVKALKMAKEELNAFVDALRNNKDNFDGPGLIDS